MLKQVIPFLMIASFFSTPLMSQGQMVPPSPGLSPIPAPAIPPVANSVMGIISSEPSFSKFRIAVILANLDTLLHYSNPVTVFIPNDTAFAKLTPEQVHQLYNPKNLPDLQAFVKNHIVLDLVSPATLANVKVKTLQGNLFRITSNPLGFFINEKIKITTPPLQGSNGLIYVIDAPLIPS